MGASETQGGLIAAVDARSKLAGNNRHELLLFGLGKSRLSGKEEVFGVNVFKVREVITRPEITAMPGAPKAVVGMVSLRGTLLPVIDTAAAIGLDVDSSSRVMVVTEFNQRMAAFLVDGVETIVRMEWSAVAEPPEMMRSSNVPVTAVSKLDDGRLLQILDLEHLIHDVAGDPDDLYAGLDEFAIAPMHVVIVDDSALARKQLGGVLDRLGIPYEAANNGAAGLRLMEKKAAAAAAGQQPITDLVSVIISDIEMPEMDGFTLVRAIKSDPRFQGVRAFLHSSISGESNERLAAEVGADGFLPKFNAASVASALAALSGSPAALPLHVNS